MSASVNKPELLSFRKNPRIEEAPLHGELMLFDAASSKFYVLNRTMAFLWRHCDGGSSFSQVVGKLQEEFDDVEPSAAEADLTKALDELVAMGLVVVDVGRASV
jgi:hypothetical protein